MIYFIRYFYKGDKKMDENNFQTFNQQPQGFQQPVVEQPINNGFQAQPQPQPQPKKKKGGITALIIILIVLLLACGGAAAYYFLVVKTPKTAINTFLDTIDSKLGEATELIEGNTELDSFKFSINVDPAADIEENSKQVVNILNNSDVQVGLGIDKANKKAIFMLQVNYNNDPVAISLYFDSTTKAVYVYSEAIYGKTIKVAELSDDAIS
jgi:flagellar basal body-associated protein FliL